MMARALIIPTLLLAFAAPAPALAQIGGLPVDPSSPTGAEYAVPLDKARGDNAKAGTHSTRRDRKHQAPAFGEGIRSDQTRSGTAIAGSGGRGSGGGGSGGGSGTRRSHAAAGHEAPTAHAGRRGHAPADAHPAPLNVRPAGAGTSGGTSSPLIAIAIGAGVLALGAIAGLAVRRRMTAT
jgi:hypothetical protein